MTERIRFLSEDVSYFRDIERTIGSLMCRTICHFFSASTGSFVARFVA